MYQSFAFNERTHRMEYTTFNAIQVAIDFCRQHAGFSCVFVAGTTVKMWDSRD